MNALYVITSVSAHLSKRARFYRIPERLGR